MPAPRIEVIPDRSAVGRDGSVMIDVLIRVSPPQPEDHFPRPRLNLAMVIDRSGSMESSRKMPFARAAAMFVVEQLLPEDRVSVTIFDNEITTIVENTPATDKKRMVSMISKIEPRGSTDLFGGWSEGANQAGTNRVEGGLNRVLLLTDGLANVGNTDANSIAQATRASAAKGVSTTTLGLGDDYNEDLLEAMAKAGDGNYYYIESPKQLVDLFQTELQGLMATSGNKVSLGLEPIDGVTIVDTLNDFERAPTGRFQLPNLIVGMPISVVVTLKVPPQPAAISPMQVRLAWDDPSSGMRQTLHARINPLNPVLIEAWDAIEIDPDVREARALLMAARAQREAGLALQRGDRSGSAVWLAKGVECLQAVPGTASIADEMIAMQQMKTSWDEGDDSHTQKFAKSRSYGRTKGYSPLSSPPPLPSKDDEPKGT